MSEEACEQNNSQAEIVQSVFKTTLRVSDASWAANRENSQVDGIQLGEVSCAGSWHTQGTQMTAVQLLASLAISANHKGTRFYK